MPNLRIYYCCDLHGASQCFRKALNVARYNLYKADVILVSGDLTGKVIVPIVKQNGLFRAEFLGSKVEIKSEIELENFTNHISKFGYYPYLTEADEYEELKKDRGKFNRLISDLIVKRIEDWVALADERLRGLSVEFYIMPGNDDDPRIRPLLTGSNLLNPEDRVIALNKVHEMVSTSATNPTPWETQGEYTEEKLSKKLEELLSGVHDMKNCIFNFHCPPFNSGLDIAPKLDTSVFPPRPVLTGGEVVKVPVGSTAIRSAIEKYQPKLGLFGHIHESAGETCIGRTLCVNPGSAYSEGTLRGHVVDMDEKGILRYFRTEG